MQTSNGDKPRQRRITRSPDSQQVKPQRIRGVEVVSLEDLGSDLEGDLVPERTYGGVGFARVHSRQRNCEVRDNRYRARCVDETDEDFASFVEACSD